MDFSIVLIAIVVILGIVLVLRISSAKRPSELAEHNAEELVEELGPEEPVVAPEPPVVPEPVIAPEPVVVPEPVAVPEPVVVPEPVAVPEPVVAPEPVAVPEPVVAKPVPTPPTAPAPVPQQLAFEEPVVEQVAPEIDRPEPVAGRMSRLRSRLSSSFGRSVLGMLGGSSISEEDWEDVEATLLQADLGVATTDRVLEQLRKDRSGDMRAALRTILLEQLEIPASRELALTGTPSVVLVVGVNGTGKTTTTGKLARLLGALDRDVVLGAADTFRAAAADQLQTWGERSGAAVVRGPEGGDPASVAFDAVSAAIDAEADVVLIDTAGRLHTKVGLMDELGKVKRVVEKQRPIQEVLLVLDATTGQNGLTQAAVFAEAVAVTGVVLTKLDGTAKGGIVFAVQQQLGVPVKFVGLGEGADDLAPFEPEAFVDALLA